MKGIGLLHKLGMVLPRQSFRSLLKDPTWIMVMLPLNEFLSSRIESVQYKAALPITRAILVSSREKLYQELALKHLLERRWMERLFLFFMDFHNKVPKYIPSLIPSIKIFSRQPNTLTSFYCTTEYFQNSVLPCVIREWNELDHDKRSYLYLNSFSKTLLNFIKPSKKKIYNIHDQVGIKLFTRLRLGFSHFREYKF